MANAVYSVLDTMNDAIALMRTMERRINELENRHHMHSTGGRVGGRLPE